MTDTPKTEALEGVRELPLIVVFPRGQLTSEDKDRMSAAGVIAVEADDPNDVVQLHLAAPLVVTGLTGDAVVMAALSAMASVPGASAGLVQNAAGVVRDNFVAKLVLAMQKARAAA